MGFLDIFKINEYKATIEQLNRKVADMETMLTPELKDTIKAQEMLRKAQQDLQTVREEHNKTISDLQSEIANLTKTVNQKKNEIIVLDDEILLQEFGLYTPMYSFMSSEEYKKKLESVRQEQKNMIKNESAAICSTKWTVNNSEAQGRKMTKDNIKQMLRSFNNECEALIDKVKFNNIDSIKKRIKKSYELLNKLNSSYCISIAQPCLNLKLDELNLAYEYFVKKQEEKEAEKERRAAMREAAKVEKELAEERKKIEKEQKHYKQALVSLMVQIDKATDDEKIELEAKKAEIESHLTDIDDSIKNLDYRENNQKAGYVYVISNIGAFGENVYKIGMTRRLEPMDRVNELGDASVPFNFDVHAMIFADDAPALEAALHRAFEDKKLNMVNTRREFFNVTLEEIEEVVKANFDKTVEFVKYPAAEQHRESLKIKASS